LLHDWDDEQGAKILANSCSAMSAKGTVLVVEHVILASNKSDLGKLADVHSSHFPLSPFDIPSKAQHL
jgi:hypothetical protein